MNTSRILFRRACVPMLVALLAFGCAREQDDDASGRIAPLLEGLGDLHHPITTKSKMAQRFFNQGLTLSYSFNHKEAGRSFREVVRLDSTCAMSYWGIALVLGPNINAQMEADDVPVAYEAVQKAMELSGKVSEKERSYILALSTRYGPTAEGSDRDALNAAYADAMRELSKKSPDDPDAVALFAESLMDMHPWDYWEGNGDPKSWTPEILLTLEGGLKRWPKHAGLNHLYIHAVEASPTPEAATASADLLPTLVPNAGHLVHMPAHIYVRTGRYHDAVVTNEKAIAADSNYITQCHAQGIYPIAYVPHNHHFLAFAAAFAGHGDKAISAARHLAMHPDQKMMREPGYGTLQHFTTIAHLAMVKFGKWDEILQEAAPPADLKYPTGVWHFARGMAYARTDQFSKADQELRKVKAIAADTSLRHVTIWDLNTTYDLMQIARDVLAGELATRRGQPGKAIEHFRNALRVEDNLTFDEPPPWFTPVRHNLGAVLLEAGRAAEAQKVYEEDLTKYPENGWSLFGLQKSLTAQGKQAEAEAVKKRFETAWRGADVSLMASRF